MRYLLDTDTCVWLIRKRDPVTSRIQAESPDDLALASMTEAELRYGALKSSDPERQNRMIESLVALVADVLPFDRAAAGVHADLRWALRAQRISDRDLVIASVAGSRGLTLVTSNRREFDRVPGLSVEDWMQPG